MIFADDARVNLLMERKSWICVISDLLRFTTCDSHFCVGQQGQARRRCCLKQAGQTALFPCSTCRSLHPPAVDHGEQDRPSRLQRAWHKPSVSGGEDPEAEDLRRQLLEGTSLRPDVRDHSGSRDGAGSYRRNLWRKQ